MQIALWRGRQIQETAGLAGWLVGWLRAAPLAPFSGGGPSWNSSLGAREGACNPASFIGPVSRCRAGEYASRGDGLRGPRRRLWRCRCLRRVVLPRRALVPLLAPFRSFRSPLLFPYRTPYIEFQQSWHRRLDSVPVCSPTFFFSRVPRASCTKTTVLRSFSRPQFWGKGVVRARRVVASSPDPRVGSQSRSNERRRIQTPRVPLPTVLFL